MTKVTFHTKEHEFSHGKKPKGSGCWAFFECTTNGDVPCATEPFFAPFGTIAECKKAVKAARQNWVNISWAP